MSIYSVKVVGSQFDRLLNSMLLTHESTPNTNTSTSDDSYMIKQKHIDVMYIMSTVYQFLNVYQCPFSQIGWESRCKVVK